VKSLRLYSSPEFDPAETGIVSCLPISAIEIALKAYPQRFLSEAWTSSKLSHPNIVPFIGVYSSLSHPFALIYAMMDKLDLGRYLADHPNVSRLKLVSRRGPYDIAGHKPLTNTPPSILIARRYLTCIEVPA